MNKKKTNRFVKVIVLGVLAFIALISGLSVFDWNQIKVGAATEGPNDPLYLASEGNWGAECFTKFIRRYGNKSN